MLKDTTVIRLRQPDAIDDPLTELAREGARRMLARHWSPKLTPSSRCGRAQSYRMVATASCVTAMGRIARSRPASGLSRFVAPRSATAAR